MDSSQEKTSIRFLSFSNDKEDAEKEAKLREAAKKIEQAIAREKSLNELIDYKEPTDSTIDPQNDSRSLYERLLEQKNKKKEALEESQKLSNLVTKLDEDEASYLNEVAKTKKEDEIKKRLEVYDAMEEKKRLDAKKLLSDEKKMKDCLIGGGLASRNTSLRSKLSAKIKVKPKIKPNDCYNEGEAKDASEKKSESNKRVNCEAGSDMKSINDSKRQKKDTNTTDRPDDADDCDREGRTPEEGKNPNACSCPRSNVMTCMGILPSLPQIRNFHDSSEDSDRSDGELDQRIVPKVGRRK